MKGDFNEARYGYCKCGCGQKTSLTPQNHTKRGWIKGEPKKFLSGHCFKGGKDNPNWKGEIKVDKQKHTSYVLIHMPEYPRSNSQGYVYEHIFVVEKMNGEPLPEGAVIHHRDSNGKNNDLDNLMVFKCHSDHMKFHRMQDKLKQRRLKNG